jgi:hypothetical protein
MSLAPIREGPIGEWGPSGSLETIGPAGDSQ